MALRALTAERSGSGARPPGRSSARASWLAWPWAQGERAGSLAKVAGPSSSSPPVAAVAAVRSASASVSSAARRAVWIHALARSGSLARSTSDQGLHPLEGEFDPRSGRGQALPAQAVARAPAKVARSRPAILGRSLVTLGPRQGGRQHQMAGPLDGGLRTPDRPQGRALRPRPGRLGCFRLERNDDRPGRHARAALALAHHHRLVGRPFPRRRHQARRSSGPPSGSSRPGSWAAARTRKAAPPAPTPARSSAPA